MRIAPPALCYLGALMAAGAIAVSTSEATPVAGSSGGPVARIARTQAVIEGDRVCIARGQYCRRSSRARRGYRRYGYDCTNRDRNGRYHLTYA